MTEYEAKTKLISWCNAQVGYTEGANNYNKYADKWTQAGGWNAQGQPWCDVFVDVAFIECFGLDNASKMTYQPKGGFSALCSQSANYYKNNGAWFASPQVGDQIFFVASGGINHTGIVVEVYGNSVTAVEGNSSDAVRKNTYPLTYPYIAGYGRPKWAVVASENTNSGNNDATTPSAPADTTQYCTPTPKMPVIEYGDKGEYVKLMQQRLMLITNDKGDHPYNCGWYGADGEYGQLTKNSLTKFQKAVGLVDDGVCGQLTWTALLGVKE